MSGPFDAKEFSTTLTKQMHELSQLHSLMEADSSIGTGLQQQVADKMRDELEPVWKDPDKLRAVTSAMKDAGAAVAYGWSPPSRTNPINIELDRDLGLPDCFDNWEGDVMVQVHHREWTSKGTDIYVEGPKASHRY